MPAANLPTLEELLRRADDDLARRYATFDVQEFVRSHPDYVRRNWFKQENASDVEREEDTLP